MPSFYVPVSGHPRHEAAGAGVVCIARQSQGGSAKGWADQYVRRQVIDLGCEEDTSWVSVESPVGQHSGRGVLWAGEGREGFRRYGARY
jgi:hypothetical protein